MRRRTAGGRRAFAPHQLGRAFDRPARELHRKLRRETQFLRRGRKRFGQRKHVGRPASRYRRDGVDRGLLVQPMKRADRAEQRLAPATLLAGASGLAKAAVTPRPIAAGVLGMARTIAPRPG